MTYTCTIREVAMTVIAKEMKTETTLTVFLTLKTMQKVDMLVPGLLED